MIISPQKVIICPQLQYAKSTYFRGVKTPPKVLMEHEICRTMCGTHAQAILIHKILTRFAGGVTEGQNLHQKWLQCPGEAPEWIKDP